MRSRDEMLKDTAEARSGYAYLKRSEDALPVRLGQDVTELLAALAEKDAEIERLKVKLQQMTMIWEASWRIPG